MRVEEQEILARLAITGLRNAVDNLRRLPGAKGDDLEEATELMNEASAWIHKWAADQEIILKVGMKT